MVDPNTATRYKIKGDANQNDSQKLVAPSPLSVTLNVSWKLPKQKNAFVSDINVFKIALIWLGHIHIHIWPPRHSSSVPPEAQPRCAHQIIIRFVKKNTANTMQNSQRYSTITGDAST